MAAMSCDRCTYYDRQHTNSGQTSQEDGLCRYNPPVTQPTPDAHGLWPVVTKTDWCGHFSTQSPAE